MIVRADNAMLCDVCQDAHYTRNTRYITACNEEGQEDFRVSRFFVGDSLAFGFGQVRSIQDFFSSLGGVKVSHATAVMHTTMHRCR